MYNLATDNPDLARIEHHPDFQSEHVKDVNPYLGQNFFPSFAKITFSVYKKTMILSRKRNQDPNRLPRFGQNFQGSRLPDKNEDAMHSYQQRGFTFQIINVSSICIFDHYFKIVFSNYSQAICLAFKSYLNCIYACYIFLDHYFSQLPPLHGLNIAESA